MPHRRAIVTVIGRPVSVTQHDNPTITMIEEVQGRYIAELMRCVSYFCRVARQWTKKFRRIWETYKDSYARHRKQELRIIE